MAATAEAGNIEAQQDVAPTVDAPTDAAAANATAATDEAPINNKRKFDEEEGGTEAGDDRQFKRAVVEPDSVLAAGSAEDKNVQPNSEAAQATSAPQNGEAEGDSAAAAKGTETESASGPANAEVEPKATDGTVAPADQATDTVAAVSAPAAAAPTAPAVDAAAAMAAAAATASALTQNAPTASAGVSAPGGLEHTLQVPGSMVGKLIGKQGETIKALQYSTQTRIQIDHQTPGDLKNVTVSGPSPDLVQQAVTQIQALVSDVGMPGQGDVSETVECPPGIVGRIIGRGGETIRGLQEASGAHIVVNQDFPEGQSRQIGVQGKADQVMRAVQMINELIQGEPGSAQAIIQKRILQYGAGVSRSLECPKGMVGRVIGKAGETIKALQKQFQCNIQIDQNSEPMTITISGQSQTVGAAANAVQEIIAGGNPFGANAPPNFAGGGGGGSAFGAPGGSGYGAPGGGYGGGYPQAQPYAQPYPQPGYGAPYGSPYGAPPHAYGGGYGAPYGADPYAQQQQPYGAPQGYAAPTAPPVAAGVWQELPDPEGRPYYYNTQTGVSVWEKPAEMQ